MDAFQQKTIATFYFVSLRRPMPWWLINTASPDKEIFSTESINIFLIFPWKHVQGTR